MSKHKTRLPIMGNKASLQSQFSNNVMGCIAHVDNETRIYNSFGSVATTTTTSQRRQQSGGSSNIAPVKTTTRSGRHASIGLNTMCECGCETQFPRKEMVRCKGNDPAYKTGCEKWLNKACRGQFWMCEECEILTNKVDQQNNNDDDSENSNDSND